MKSWIGLATICTICLAFTGCAEQGWKPAASAPIGWGSNNPCASLPEVSHANPRYPHAAANESQEGWVALKYHVAANGDVFNVRVVASSPEGVFDDASAKALVRTHYAPMEYPVRNCSQLDVYTMNGAGARPIQVGSAGTN